MLGPVRLVPGPREEILKFELKLVGSDGEKDKTEKHSRNFKIITPESS